MRRNSSKRPPQPNRRGRVSIPATARIYRKKSDFVSQPEKFVVTSAPPFTLADEDIEKMFGDLPGYERKWSPLKGMYAIVFDNEAHAKAATALHAHGQEYTTESGKKVKLFVQHVEY